jgi:hypothetical protein
MITVQNRWNQPKRERKPLHASADALKSSRHREQASIVLEYQHDAAHAIGLPGGPVK